MSPYAVYLEIEPVGACMVHVPELPGCFLRAEHSEQALMQLPARIREHADWLRRHGEDFALPPEPIHLQIVETSTGCAPLRRGDPAALFTCDLAPLHAEEMERCFRLAGYTREEVLTLVRSLPAYLLRRKVSVEAMSVEAMSVEAMSVEEILRHVGNTEEWYVSRLVDPATLPPEWEHDEDLPILPFLEMERRTVVERLRRLSAHECAAVLYQTRWTDAPEEEWTARKAVRRLLEHEREHLEHIRAVLREVGQTGRHPAL